jgi:hypothetical protein
MNQEEHQGDDADHHGQAGEDTSNECAQHHSIYSQ